MSLGFPRLLLFIFAYKTSIFMKGVDYMNKIISIIGNVLKSFFVCIISLIVIIIMAMLLLLGIFMVTIYSIIDSSDPLENMGVFFDSVISAFKD